jgi:MFS family permease
MRLAPLPARSRRSSALADIRAGLRYVASHTVIRIIVLNLAVISLFGLGFVTLMPAWAVKVLGGDAATNGFLQSARGIGALLGALMIASMGRYVQRGRLLTLGSFVFPALLLVFAGARWLPLSLLMLVGVGWGFMVMMNSANAIVQTEVEDELRGRVMSIYTLTFFGLMPVGSLLAGAAAARIGEPFTVATAALVLLGFSTLIYWKVPQLRLAE